MPQNVICQVRKASQKIGVGFFPILERLALSKKRYQNIFHNILYVPKNLQCPASHLCQSVQYHTNSPLAFGFKHFIDYTLLLH